MPRRRSNGQASGGSNPRSRPHFEVCGLDFGTDLTDHAKKSLTEITTVLRNLHVEQDDTVVRWFEAMAYVSRTYYSGWDTDRRKKFGQGLSRVLTELPSDDPTAAINALVRTSLLTHKGSREAKITFLATGTFYDQWTSLGDCCE